MICSEEQLHFSTSTQIQESVHMLGHNIEGMSKVNTVAIE